MKEVGSSHEDAPDALLPAHDLSDPTAQMSWVEEAVCEPPIPRAAPFILIGHVTCCTCAVSDVTSDITTTQDNVTSWIIMKM